MAYENPHGKAAGLPDRLRRFADGLCQDRRYPWAGTGLVDDLRAAAALVEGKPLPLTLDEQEEMGDLAKRGSAPLEYDL